MSKTDDMLGEIYGRLLVVARLMNRRCNKDYPYLECYCECGTITQVHRNNLRRGLTKSCGCLRREVSTERMTKHGMARSRTGKLPAKEYRAWQSMKHRCLNKKNNPDWHNYGGRGITVCEEWLHDFPVFYAHIGAAPSPDHSVDRIEVNGHYEPGNVRWATDEEQARNKQWHQTHLERRRNARQPTGAAQ